MARWGLHLATVSVISTTALLGLIVLNTRTVGEPRPVELSGLRRPANATPHEPLALQDPGQGVERGVRMSRRGVGSNRVCMSLMHAHSAIHCGLRRLRVPRTSRACA